MKKPYFKRAIDEVLLDWSKQEDRKPILLRGARQVGKSSTVRNLSINFEYFVEVNFEKRQDVRAVFEGDLSPKDICRKLSAIYNMPIIDGKTLLFFDEIQNCIPAISSLRFFYEDYPQLHLIAAGSLFEFALESLASFGVGRVRSAFMYPFSFMEFLSACKEELLIEEIEKASPENPLLEPLHNKALEYLRQFLIIGGMPSVVSKFVEKKDIRECQYILDDLIISLKADFAKYKKRIPQLRILTVFESVVRQIGEKFTYSKIGQEYNYVQMKESLELLQMAGLVISVIHTSANGIPLGAQVNPKKQKMLLIDCGIFQRFLGLEIADILLNNDLSVVNKGNIAELYAGLELLKSQNPYSQQPLFYWQRESKNSNAEIDYIIQKSDKIIPIEIKSNKKGSMQSLHLFLKEKNVDFAIRSSLENFAKYEKIRVYPLYAIKNIVKKPFEQK
ncbi:MAG: ATP-binding protein [Elusimicrobiota bacterium]|jgi:predicted AAA+ superfamily ATPase|nr:ATP-binding protein [Elusimicrobiota bacterium]